jgi:REP element-mobilizing transposase RayT
MTRGIRKLPIYEDDHDRRLFIDTIAETARCYEALIYSACEMGTHYHMVLETPRGNLSAVMQHLNGTYAQSFNRRHGRCGHVFEARFRSVVVQRERYLRRVVRYVERNPVKAGLTTDAESWPWNTYRWIAGLDAAPEWLHLDWLEWAFEAATRAEAQARFRHYVNHRNAAKSRVDTSAIAIGSPRFKESIEREAIERNRPLPLSCKLPTRVMLSELFAVSGVRVDLADTMRLAHERHRYTMAEIARHLGLDRSTVGKRIKRVAMCSRAAAMKPVEGVK